MIEKKILLVFVLNFCFGFLLLSINFIYFKEFPSIFSALSIVSFLLITSPPAFYFYIDYKRRKEIETIFPIFLMDFVEAIRGGLTVPHALKLISSNDYKALSPYVKKMAAQMDWGIPVEVVFQNFVKETKSKIIGRIVSSVIESHRFGGNLADTFEALSNTALDIERLRTERKLYLQSQMITGYIIFFVFLGVMIGLEKFLVPTLTQASMPGMGLGQTQISQTGLAEEYKILFRNLILIQGFFAGLIVGKMVEGALIGGIKHSIIMMVVGGVIFSLLG
jgi:flagellar protein FlaJ